MVREIGEEWGIEIENLKIGKPEFLTTMPIENIKQVCKFHFDVWYFINMNSETFSPDKDKLAEETYEMRWLDLEKAREIVIDKNTLLALDFIEKKYF